ncbi:GAF domain-containing protein [Dactylosporangium aurantiacum]|uniref:GAF domain-containing protein n=1 Tax=Dactylosporangium aurantiacum TaxID=35754 RepID=A0A9Q9ID29_9ACTN|nr:GAF domain-containing protein [Dactylosporangium aurantiacum]MDG6109283.1 GAF domain-containing protein [Dactylosporangium aurantiacum]UWZ50370.1 GAF domain-containing protein [Dactylosporangium aurantiacum]
MTTPTYLSDLDRLRSVARYDLHSPDLRHLLDGIAARTAERLGGSVAAVNILLDRAVMIIAGAGEHRATAAIGGGPAEWSFCSRVVAEGRPVVVADATADPGDDVDGAPLAATGLRAYAGVPLTAGNGHVLGAHCAMHAEPGRYNESTLRVLEAAATEIMAALERYRAA